MEELRQLIRSYRDVPLSDKDIQDEMGGNANIVVYSQIQDYESIDQLIEPYGVCFILYEWKPHYGHWCLLSKHDNLLEFFDPYSGMPDDELDHVPKRFRKKLGEDHPYLCDLLRACDYDLSYNEFQFQKLSPDISTCGRWCILRAILKDLTLYQFKNLFLNAYGDDIATILTS